MVDFREAFEIRTETDWDPKYSLVTFNFGMNTSLLGLFISSLFIDSKMSLLTNYKWWGWVVRNKLEILTHSFLNSISNN